MNISCLQEHLAKGLSIVGRAVATRTTLPIPVPARLLTDFVNSLPSEKIEMTLAPRSRQLKLVCARNQATIAGVDADDFPPIPSVEDGGSLQLDPQELHTAISQAIIAAATDDSRPVLTGVDVLMEGDQLTLAAADGFRLSVRHLTLPKAVPERVEGIIPARPLSGLEPRPPA